MTDPKSKDDETDSTYITESDHIPDTIGDIDYSFELTSIYAHTYPRDKFIEAGATPTKRLDSVQSLPVIKITSTEQLEFFKQTMNGTIDFKASYNDAIPAFDDISYKYNNAYFEKNNLLLVYTYAPDTSKRFLVEYVEKNSLMLTVAISQLNISAAADEAERHYLVAVNVDKNKTIDVENVEAFISSKIYPDKELTAKNVIKKYVSLESDDMLPSAVSLFDNGRFIFTFPSYSSYMEYGTYEEKDDLLILTAEDGKIYSFNTNTDFISFDAESSAKEPWTSLINNGAIYTEVAIGNIPFTFDAAVFFPKSEGMDKLEEVGLFQTKVLSDKSFAYSTIKISSKAELDNFMNVVGEDFDRDNFLKPDYVPTFGDHSKKYSDEYFKNNTLLLIYGVTDLSSDLSVDCVYSFSSKMSITMTEFSPGYGLACPVYWLIGVNISKNYNLDYVKDIQTISNVCIFPEEVNNLTNATNRYFLPASEGNTAYSVVLLSNERFILGKNQNFLFGKYEKNSKRLKLTVEEGKVYYFDIGDGYIEFDAKASYDTLGLIDRSRFVSDYKPVKSQFKYSVISLNGDISYEKFKEAGTTVSNGSNTAKSLPVIKIKSKAELNAFKEKTKDAIDYASSYSMFNYEMNNINFNKYDALLVFLRAPDLSTRYTVDYVKNGYGKYEIGITEISPPAALTAGASWLVVVKIAKDESLSSCNALISSKVYPDGLYDTDNKKAVRRYVHPLYLENEETPCAVTLFDDGRFTFTFGAESDFTSCGFYEESNVRLKLKGEEGDVYFFDLKDGQIIFDADASSSGHSVVKRVDDATAFVKTEPPSKSYYV